MPRGASLLPHSRLGVHSRRLPALPIGIFSAAIFAHPDQVDIQGKPTLFQAFCDFQLAATRSPKMRLTVVQDHRVKLFWQEICHLSPKCRLNSPCPETALAQVSPCDLPAGSYVLRSVPQGLQTAPCCSFFPGYQHMAPSYIPGCCLLRWVLSSWLPDPSEALSFNTSFHQL